MACGDRELASSRTQAVGDSQRAEYDEEQTMVRGTSRASAEGLGEN